MNLKSYLADIDMTLVDFGKLIEYSPNYLSRVINGYGKPGKGLIEKVKDITGGAVILKDTSPKKTVTKEEKK